MKLKIKEFLNSKWFPPALGLLFILAYWYLIHPPGFGRLGYLEDLCMDQVRHLMAQKLNSVGRPEFFSDYVMAPFGATIPYMSWSIERDWLGAYVWMVSRDFPYLWLYYGLSLVVTYLGVSYLIKRMGLTIWSTMLLATVAVLFHVPRHFKTFHHWEMLPQHWFYWSFFLDAWIWKEAVEKNRFRLHLELWRGFFLVGMMTSAGYWWGPQILEWALTRAGLVLLFSLRRKKPDFTFSFKRSVFPIISMAILIPLEFRWFLPLSEEVAKLGKIWQPAWWFGPFARIFEPLWLKPIWPVLQWLNIVSGPFTVVNASETAVTIGWIFWVPFLTALVVGIKRQKTKVLLTAGPLLWILVIFILYFNETVSPGYQTFWRKIVPFMEYFRTTSRGALMLPALVSALIVLLWPNLLIVWNQIVARPKLHRIIFWCGILSTGAEMHYLFTPVNAMVPIPKKAEQVLAQIKNEPGSLVLDLPFCVAGGNAVCTGDQCPFYPKSLAGQCFSTWHDKKVYGLYQARMTESHCQIYRREPFTQWMQAWKENRCFNDLEWISLCSYLERVPDHAAVMVYPDSWTGASKPECREQFQKYFGEPKDQFSVPRHSTPYAPPVRGVDRVWVFPGRCRS